MRSTGPLWPYKTQAKQAPQDPGRFTENRAHIRDERRSSISIERGCPLMSLSRSTFYAVPQDKPSDGGIVAEIRAITDVFECYEGGIR